MPQKKLGERFQGCAGSLTSPNDTIYCNLYHVLLTTSEQKSEDLSTEELFKRYEQRIKTFEANVDDFPTDGNRITSQRWRSARKDIAFHMKQTYPLVHGGLIALAYNFLNIKVIPTSNLNYQISTKHVLCYLIF